jgi:putative transposon-encoded protein
MKLRLSFNYSFCHVIFEEGMTENYSNRSKPREKQILKDLEVKKFGSGGHIILPRDWVGKRVLVKVLE